MNGLPFEIRDLRYFVAVCEAKAFARAAQSLATSPSNVSMRMCALERSLGARLFERARYGIELTDRGRLLYRHARQVLAQLERIPAALDESDAA